MLWATTFRWLPITALGTECFRPSVARPPRTSSASPMPNATMRRNYSSASLKRSNSSISSNGKSMLTSAAAAATVKKTAAVKKTSTVENNMQKEVADEQDNDDDQLILKRMEEILMTYKSKVGSYITIPTTYFIT